MFTSQETNSNMNCNFLFLSVYYIGKYYFKYRTIQTTFCLHKLIGSGVQGSDFCSFVSDSDRDLLINITTYIKL